MKKYIFSIIAFTCITHSTQSITSDKKKRTFSEAFGQTHYYRTEAKQRRPENTKHFFEFIKTFNPQDTRNNHIKLNELMQTGIQTNKYDENGNTPLFYTVQTNQWFLIELLINNGANPLCLNKNNTKASDIAQDEEIKKKLLKIENELLSHTSKTPQPLDTKPTPTDPQPTDNTSIVELLIQCALTNDSSLFSDALKNVKLTFDQIVTIRTQLTELLGELAQPFINTINNYTLLTVHNTSINTLPVMPTQTCEVIEKTTSSSKQYTTLTSELEIEFETYHDTFVNIQRPEQIKALKRYIYTEYSPMDFAIFIDQTPLTDDEITELLDYTLAQNKEEAAFYMTTLLNKLEHEIRDALLMSYENEHEVLVKKIQKMFCSIAFMEKLIDIMNNTQSATMNSEEFENNYGTELAGLLEDGADINDHRPGLILAIDKYSQCPLICALHSENPAVVKFLLKHGASCDVLNILEEATATQIAQNMYEIYQSSKVIKENFLSILSYTPTYNAKAYCENKGIPIFQSLPPKEQKTTLLMMLCNEYQLNNLGTLVAMYLSKCGQNKQELYTELFTHALIVYKNNSHAYNLPLVLMHLVGITPPEYYQIIKETLLKKYPQLKEFINNALGN